MADYVVVGAAGTVGWEVATALVNRGNRVVAPVRGVRRVPEGVETVAADAGDLKSMAGVLSGMQGLFLLPGIRPTSDLLQAAIDRGLSRVVLLSSAATEDLANHDALTTYHRRSEEAVRESGLPWTLLRPQAFASNVLRWRDQLRVSDEVKLPFPDLRIACIDPRDLGEVAAVALTDSGLEGEALRLTGPEALLPAEQLAIVSHVLKRPLRGIPLDDPATREHLLVATPTVIVDSFLALYREGGLDESVVTDGVARVLGRPAGTFRAWAVRHREALAK